MINNSIKTHAKIQEERMSVILSQLADTCLYLDAVIGNGASTAAYMNYSEQDMYHAATIFFSIASNYAIHKGLLTDKNGVEQATKFRECIKDVFGLDTVQEAQVDIMLSQIKNNVI